MSYDTGSPQSFAALDSIRRFYDERDPLKPGMWAMGGRIGKISGDLWDFIARADARFGIVTDIERWVRLKAEYGVVDEEDARRVAMQAKRKK